MYSFANIFKPILSWLLAMLYSIISLFTTGSPKSNSLPKTPDDFSPVVRFAVCSDVHLNGEEDQAEVTRLAKLFETAYDYSDGCDYTALDAVVVCGDFATSGKPEEYQMFNKIVDENIKDGTQLLTTIGNHEFISYRDYDPAQGIAVYEEQMGRPANEHFVIGGYHFITVSYSEDAKTFTTRTGWLRQELNKAVADTGDKPIFVFQHPAPFGTVYGSINWGDLTMVEVLSAYPQVIDFSGHSHYPINDPRSLWQGTFTALGCGTLSYFETELDGVAGNFPYEPEQAAQYYIVEGDKDGNVCIKSFDILTNSFFDNEYYLTGLAKKNYPYNYDNMKGLDEPPVFPEDTEISVTTNDDGESILTFTGATDKFVVESYKVSWAKDGIIMSGDANFSGKYMYKFMEDEYEVNMGKLDSGKKYVVEIVAFNAYVEKSEPLHFEFTAK